MGRTNGEPEQGSYSLTDMLRTVSRQWHKYYTRSPKGNEYNNCVYLSSFNPSGAQCPDTSQKYVFLSFLDNEMTQVVDVLSRQTIMDTFILRIQ